MLVKLLGIEKIDYFSTKKNAQVRGSNLHVAFDNDHVVGTAVKTFYVSEKSPLYTKKLSVDKFYNLYFNQFGGVDELVEVANQK